MRHKTGFFIGYATLAGRSGLMPVGEECYSYGISQLCPAAVRQGGRGKPQPWRAVTAAVRAMQRFIACYGIPEPVQTDNRVESTNRYTSPPHVECSASPAMA
jgi:hypothetical protein